MLLHNKDKLNKIEELKSKLFNKNYQTRIEHYDSFPHFQKRKVMDFWEKKESAEPDFKEKFFMKTSMFKKFFIFSIVFFILALGYASYMFGDDFCWGGKRREYKISTFWRTGKYSPDKNFS